MDVLRSCYQTNMAFDESGEGSQGVFWYFTPPGAKVFPTWHRFASGNYNKGEYPWFGPGEIYPAPRPWIPGNSPPGMIGLEPCGPLEVFQKGQTVDDPGICTEPDGSSNCCGWFRSSCVTCQDSMPDLVTATILAVRADHPNPVGVVGQQFEMFKYILGASIGYLAVDPFLAPCAIPIFYPFAPNFYCGDDNGRWIWTSQLPGGTTQAITLVQSRTPLGIYVFNLQVYGCIAPIISEYWDILVGQMPPAPTGPPRVAVGFTPPGYFPPCCW